jgi:tripartite-type tricarboxylate transporter receptor subunit TctC
MPRITLAQAPVVLLVGGVPGSTTDREARWFAPFLARHLPSSDIDIRDLPAAAGLGALQALAASAPGGGVLGWVSTPTLPARIVDHGATGLLPRLTLLGAVQQEPIVVVAPSATSLSSVQDLLEQATNGASLATPRTGSPPHLAALRLQALTGERLNLLEFPSAAAARQAALAGTVAAAVLGLSNVVDALRTGRLAGLGIAMEQRIATFPGMPSLTETGIDLLASIRRGLGAQASLPGETATRLVAALQAVVADPGFAAEADARGFIVSWTDGAAWLALVEKKQAELAKLWATDPWLPAGAD